MSELDAGPILGKTLKLNDDDLPCPKCQSMVVKIGEGKAMHAAHQVCANCGHWRRWLKTQEVEALLETTRLFGWPDSVAVRPLSPHFAFMDTTEPSGASAVVNVSALKANESQNKMVKISEAFPSRYLKATDLHDCERKVAIKNVTYEKLGEDLKPVIEYRGWAKLHPLNKGVSLFLADGLGDDTNGWIGREIMIFPAGQDYQGKRYEVIRARFPTARDAKTPVTTTMPTPGDEEAPF